MKRLIIHLLAIIGLLVVTARPGVAQTFKTAPDYVGTQTCANCHSGEAQAWAGSDHALAWTLPDETTVLGDFDDAIFKRKGVTTRFFRRNGEYFIETQGADGKNATFKVTGVAGVRPLQQYLLATEGGRVQAFDIAWDVEKKRWYDVFPTQNRPPGDGLHWTGPYKNWNGRCAECHATGFEKNYNASTRTYASRQAEIGVGCEACHGPGSAHVSWAKAPDAYDPAAWPGLSPKGFTIDFAAGTAETEVQQCAACHSLRETFVGGSPVPGTPYHDAYRLALLRDGLYQPDGAIEDEVYVYGSFLQSKMSAKGVRCSDCHNTKTTALKAQGNAVCAQCHSPTGNPRFPSLTLAEYDNPSHTFHPKNTAGAKCVACHLIERVYMGNDGRRDHSFRIPRPDLSSVTGASNSCTDCHTDRDAAWAAVEIAQRYPDSKRRGPHFSQTFAAARTNPVANADILMGFAAYDGLPGIVRASALELLQSAANEAIAATAAPLINDKDPLVRAAAIALQQGATPADLVRRIVPAFDDPVRSVRIAAARAFVKVPVARLPAPIAKAAENASSEWRASLIAKTDFPETLMVLGGASLASRKVRAAERAFREAVQLDPQLIQAWMLITRILAATGDRDGARAALNDALAANPSNQILLSLGRQMGIK